ncbi:PucR family transcriptional regulator ligand-binding domain-containing protein [Tissierella praeacuta]|uniref:PucR family transcriptional regulator n=1 Tax=Tissierella praeacuta TaxID=43131 RepID=UPI0033408270
MGVSLREILASDFFLEARVLAGKEGLDRIVQGISSQDAPTGGQWARGKELMLATGYLFKDNIEYLKEIIIESNECNAAGLGIKVGRYLDEIPEEIIDLCNELKFPLIDLPKDAAWMEIGNAINEIAIDRYIEKLTGFIQVYGNKDHDRKIKEIIEGLYNNIGKPVEVYDFCKNKRYSVFDKNIKNNELSDYEFIWNPGSKHEKKNLSEKFNMFRIKNLESEDDSQRIVLPIEIDNIVLAYLVVWEDQEKSDYYDLYTIRLSFVLLLHEYGSIYFENTFKDKFQDELIQQIIDSNFQNETQIIKKVLDTEGSYLCISVKQFSDEISLYDHREKISRCIYNIFQRDEMIFGLTGKDEMVMIYKKNKDIHEIKEFIKTSINQLIRCIENEITKGKFVAGVSPGFVDIKDVKNSYTESYKTIDISRYVYPESKVIFYDDLGPFKFINIEEFKKENMSVYNEYIKPLTLEEDGEELIITLKSFLECNQNYSLTAKKLFVHNNTVRYRISKIKDLIKIDNEDSIERLKIEIVLKFLRLFN